MNIPALRGVIDRRILVNFRVRADVLAERLPAPFRPKLVAGFGMAGICLIRLARIRPRFLPVPFGLGSENAAHRIAVEWDEDGAIRQGVYIPRRDTSSRLNALVGGRLFPGVHHHSRFRIEERDGRYSVTMNGDDGTSLAVEGRETSEWPAGSVFGSLREASDFFAAGSVGYSDSACAGCFDGLELRTFGWSVAPLAVDRVESNVFDDAAAFPPGSVEFDCALLMRGLDHEWHARPPLRAGRQPIIAQA